MATPPSVFGLISDNLEKAGFKTSSAGWKRIIVEKPFGTDLPSAIALNREILKYWTEDQIYRIDHYLGKETVQNILAFRFSNGMFEPLWNRNYIDHIQFSVSEAVGVEGRGGYYDRSGVLRDMLQNHMFQMLAYLCMEPPGSFAPEAVRNEKSKVLEAVRVMDAEHSAHPHGSRPVRPRHWPGWHAGSRLSGRSERAAAVQNGDLRGGEAVHRQLAMARRSHLSSFRQAVVEARNGDRGPVEEPARRRVPRHGCPNDRAQPADLSHPAGPGHRAALSSQDAGAADEPAKGEHALRLQPGVHGLARGRATKCSSTTA